MRDDDTAPSQRFLAEWYTPSLEKRPIGDVAQCIRRALAGPSTDSGADACGTELLYALEVPEDSYAFGVFVADSAELVANACERAGIPADRVTPAVEAPTQQAT